MMMGFFSLKCPTCGKDKIFRSILKIKPAEQCDNCGLDYTKFDIGDAPAYMGVFIICFVIPILAIITEIYFSPALIVHALLWFPLTIIFTYIILIYSRSYFIHKEFERKVQEASN